MEKEFLDFYTIRNNALKLAHQIHKSGFIPDVIYVSLRGGAYVGNVISEYFKVVRRNQRPVYYAAVVARSYIGINAQEKVMVDGWTYNPNYLRHGDKVLLVDDIFDSGNTINYLVDLIMEKGIPREDIKVAVHDYKIRTFQSQVHPVQPDFYCRKLVVPSPEKDFWIHYLSHELVGLTETEIKNYYTNSDPELREIFQEMGLL
ncbi:MAG: phosphoribosyltransferase [Spirochaetales bacterium]